MAVHVPHLTRYQRWLAEHRGLQFDSYDALWQWSITDLRAFWGSLWNYYEVESPTGYETELVAPVMPGASWFPGAQLNHARHLLHHADAAHAAGHPAIVFQSERLAAPVEISWPELRRQAASLATQLVAMGVQPGDRVAAFMPNLPQTIVAFVACASVGAVWSVCSPDMGPVAVLDRFRQIEPKVLIAVDGYVYGGVSHDRRGVLAQLLADLPSVGDVVLLPCLDEAADAQAFAAPARRAHDFNVLAADDARFEPPAH